jgi:hypothetical protein
MPGVERVPAHAKGREMRAFRPVLALLFALGLASSCGAEQRAPAEEALGASLKVGSLSVSRAQKKDCWVRCGAGSVCNVDSGRCEPGKCLARCDVAWHCVHDVEDGDYCLRDSDGTGTPGSLHGSPAPKASLPTDAGTLDAAFLGSADAATDASGTLRQPTPARSAFDEALHDVF